MTFKEIQDLIKLVAKLDLTEFKMRDGEFELAIRTKNYGKAKQVPAAPAPPATTVVPVPSVQQPFPHPTPPPPPAPEEPEAGSQPERTEEAADQNNYKEIRSPMVGTFYRSPSPDKPPYAKVGDTVEVGSVVCIVEAMKLFNEIESDVSGRIVKVMIEDASPVEYDQVLFLVDPKG